MTWTAQFSSSASGALSAGDTISVVFPNGFVIPDAPTVALTGAGYAGCGAPAASTVVATVTITLGVGCTLSASSLGTLTIAGVTNPVEGTYANTGFTVASSRDTTTASTGSSIDIFGLPTAFTLTPASGTPTAAVADNLTITAIDSGARTVANYTGDHSLTFSGANNSTNPATTPTVSDKTGAATNFGTATTITFTNGVATVAGANNGVMKLYKAESPTVSVTDGSISGNSGLVVSSAATTRLVVTGSAAQTAGAAQALTIKATDPYGNTDTTYAGAHNLTFSGANNSTNPATTPTVTNNAAAAINFGSSTAITFTAGVATSGGSMKLYKVESATVAVTDGTISAAGADRLSVTVTAAAASRLVVTGSAAQTAGAAQALTITATDPYGNTDLTYAGAHNLTFSGANNSTNPATTPTVTNNAAAATNFGSSTAITFTAGVSSSGGSMKLYKVEAAVVAVTDGTILAAGADRLNVAVAAAAASRLVVTGSAAQTAGAAQALTITATDPYGNTDLTYAGAHNLTFSGANNSTNPATTPTVTNNAAAATNFGTATAITFTAGVSSSGGSMKLYKVEAAVVAVTDGTILAAGTDRLTVTVTAAAASRLVVTGSAAQNAGAAQALTIKATDPYGNTDLTYAGAHNLTFSGANNSTNPATTPTVTNNAAAATNFGTATAITFTAGVSSSGGSMKLYKVEAAVVVATDGTILAAGADRLSVTVTAAAASRLVVTGAGSQTAGNAQALTITATDPYGNTDLTYAGAHNLTFSGANSSTSPVTAPTVTNNAAAATNFGTATAITFTAGVSSSGGSMKLYKVEAAVVAATDGTILAAGADRLSVGVTSNSATRLVVTGSAAQTAGGSQVATVTATDAYGNTDTAYSGNHTLTFTGASSSTNPATAPTFRDRLAVDQNFGAANTSLTFIAGVGTGTMKLYKTEAAVIATTDGTLSAAGADRLSVAVTAAAASRLVVTGSAAQNAGAAQALTITATDPYGNTDLTYAGAHNLTFSGANNSTNPATTPTVTNNAAAATNFGSSTAITFTAGVSSTGGSMKLYKVEAAVVAATDGTILAAGADRLNVAVTAAAASRLVVTGSAAQTAGAAQALTITATDPYGNTDLTYTGAKNLTFSGANSSTNPATAPTVTNNAAAATNFGSSTAITFTAGVSSTGGSMKLYKVEAAVVAATDGTILAAGTDRLNVAVTAAAASRLVVTGSAAQTAGAAQALTIKATDPYGNTDLTYAGAHNLTFSGANNSTNPATTPTVTNNAAAATNFGTATAITFTAGVSSSGGSMKLYKVEAAVVAATDGTIAAAGADRLNVAVTAAAASRLVVTGSAAQTAGAAQALTITATDPYGNTDLTYAGAQNLTFSGANSSDQPRHHPDRHQQRRHRQPTSARAPRSPSPRASRAPAAR